MSRLSIAVLGACIGLAFAAPTASAGPISATRAVIAIVHGDLFVGRAEGHLNGAGTLSIRSQQQPDLTCLGEFTSTAEQGGLGQMACSDGTTATFQFQRLTVFRGYGAGTTSRGSMSFAYGIDVADVGPYLKLPGRKKLVRTGTGLKLVDHP